MTERETRKVAAARIQRAAKAVNDHALKAERAILGHDHDTRVRAAVRQRLVVVFVAAATDAKWKPAEVAFCLKGGPL